MCCFRDTNSYRGPEVIKWTNRFLVGALLVVGVIVFFISLTSVPFSEILAVKPVNQEGISALERFMMSAEGNVAFAFSWSTQALVMPRLAKTERSGYWGTTLSYGVVAPFLCCNRWSYDFSNVCKNRCL